MTLRSLLELARIGSLLFVLVDSPHDQIGSSSPIDTFATRLSAQPLSPLYNTGPEPRWTPARYVAPEISSCRASRAIGPGPSPKGRAEAPIRSPGLGFASA